MIKQRIIVTKLAGGLCNQMFQYAVAKNLAIKNHAELQLDTSFYDVDQGSHITKREYELSKFMVNAKIADIKTVDKFNRTKKPLFNKYLKIKEKGMPFEKSVLEMRGNIYIAGHWMTEKYFLEIRSILLKEFTLNKEIDKQALNCLSSINASKSVSVHVRRGDYITNSSANSFHGVCDSEYYKKCMKYIKQKCMKPIFYIFSDDIEWCKSEFKGDNIVFVEGNSGEVDLILMKSCKHNITANSTFSWWAAWLNENPTKIVLTPTSWFKDPSIDTSDLLPNGWIKL